MARTYRLCSAAEVASFEAHAVQVLQAWARRWSGEVAAPALECSLAQPLGGDLPASGWVCAEGAHGSAWAGPEAAAAMAGLLFDNPVIAGEVALEAGLRALTALLQQLTGAPQAGEREAPAHLSQPGRALLQLTLRRGSASLRLFVELPEAQLPAAARKPAPLGSARVAIGQQPVTVEVRLGEAEIALGALATLRVGDVLVLDRRLDDGVELRVDQQRLPCVGYLGSLDGHVAVEVARR